MSEQDNVELHDEDNQIEEAHDTKNAEAQSVASVAAASSSVKQSPMPKTKAGMINAMYSKMNGMKKDQLAAAYAKMHEEFGEMVEEEAVELPETSYNFSQELSELVESEATLSDEFKGKTAVIFETAIRSKITEEVDRLENEYHTKLEEEVQSTRDDLVEKVDNYLNYVVETWMEANQIALEQGMRTEIAEGFMDNLKQLFVESYIEVPESKVDLVDELASEVEELEEKLNSATEAMMSLNEEIQAQKRETIIRESANDLAQTEVEKLRSLVESLDFEDEEAFAQKVKTVKESYFKKEIITESEEIVEDWANDLPSEVTSTMDRYLQAIKKTTKE